MIDYYYTGTPTPSLSGQTSAPRVLPYEPASVEYISTPLEIKPNSIIILRCSHDYSLDEMNALRDYYKQVFPNNQICVMYEDIDINIVNDNSYRGRPCAEHTGDYYG